MTTAEIIAIKVKDVMSTDLVIANKDTTMEEIDRLMGVHNIHHIPVVDKEGTLLGIVSRRDVDILKDWASSLNLESSNKFNEQILGSQLVSDRMTTAVAKVTPEDTLECCADIFKENIFHALPVVRDKKLVGLITTYDLINVAYTKSPLLN